RKLVHKCLAKMEVVIHCLCFFRIELRISIFIEEIKNSSKLFQTLKSVDFIQIHRIMPIKKQVVLFLCVKSEGLMQSLENPLVEISQLLHEIIHLLDRIQP